MNALLRHARAAASSALLAQVLVLTSCSSQTSNAVQVQFESAPHQIAMGSRGSPQFVFGSGGDLQMMSALNRGDTVELRAYVSRDAADTLKDLWPISPRGTEPAFQSESRPRLAMNRDEDLYVTWNQMAPASEVLIASHDWRNNGFTHPTRVRDIRSKSFSGFSDMAVAPNGNVYVVWLDERGMAKSGDVSAVYFARSTDSGRTFQKNIRVAAHTCSCCRPTLTLGPDGTIYVAWRHNYNNVRDMAVASSADGGKTFSTPVRVASDGWKIYGCPESGPSLLVDGTRLYIAWFTLGADSTPHVKLSWSDDRGKSFAQPIHLAQTLVDANHPMLFAGKPDGVWVAFQARDAQSNGGWGPIRIYIERLTPDPAKADPIAVSPENAGDAQYPYAVMRDASSIFVGYTTRKGAMLIRGRINEPHAKRDRDVTLRHTQDDT